MDAEGPMQDFLVEEEPRYLRRQKPVEIKRRKFGKGAVKGYLRTGGLVLSVSAGLAAAAGAGHFLLRSPRMALLHPSQISVSGNQYVTPESIYSVFAQDRGRSVLLIPIEKRRSEIEAMPWVATATVRRVLPNHLAVEITERTPVAWLREGTELLLMDAHGVILDRPPAGKFHFPVVTGLKPEIPEEERGRRMNLYTEFTEQIEQVEAGASEGVSEVDLSQANDVRVSFDRLVGEAPAQAAAPGNAPPSTASTTSDAPGNTATAETAAGGGAAAADAPPEATNLVVDFGDRDFAGKYSALVENIAQWRAAAGHVYAVDLRFGKQAVVNPAGPPAATAGTAAGGAAPPAATEAGQPGEAVAAKAAEARQ